MRDSDAAPASAIFWVSIAATHPALPGHFPGRPIVPGVLLLERLLAALRDHAPEYQTLDFPTIKFLRPAAADTELLLGIELAPPATGKFIYRNRSQTLAQGSFKLQPVPMAAQLT